MSMKKRSIYFTSIMLLGVSIFFFEKFFYMLIFDNRLVSLFSPSADLQTDYYTIVFSDVAVSILVLLFSKFVLHKFHNQEGGHTNSSLCACVVMTHFVVSFFTLFTFMVKIEWQYDSAFGFIFSILFLMCLVAYSRYTVSAELAVSKGRRFLFGAALAILLVVAGWQINTLLFSLDDYVYVAASPIAMLIFPFMRLLEPVIAHVFNPEFLTVMGWRDLCTDVLPYCLLAILVDYSKIKFRSRKHEHHPVVGRHCFANSKT